MKMVLVLALGAGLALGPTQASFQTPISTEASGECPFVSSAIPPGMCLSSNLGLPYYPPTPPANTGIGGAGAGIPRMVSIRL